MKLYDETGKLISESEAAFYVSHRSPKRLSYVLIYPKGSNWPHGTHVMLTWREWQAFTQYVIKEARV